MNSRSLELWHFGVPTVTDMEATAACCEELGFDGLTLTDSQNLSPDTYVALTLPARATTAHRYQHPGLGRSVQQISAAAMPRSGASWRSWASRSR